MSGMLPAVAMAIKLVNAGEVPERVLRRAEETAAAIFARAGIGVVWVDCRVESCAVRSGVWVQFAGRRGGPAGYSMLVRQGSGYAVVRYPVVEQQAGAMEVDAGPLLGATIAHEIGHLLLGKGHTRGVMAARLGRGEVSRAARGELAFRDEEARRLRAAVSGAPAP